MGQLHGVYECLRERGLNLHKTWARGLFPSTKGANPDDSVAVICSLYPRDRHSDLSIPLRIPSDCSCPSLWPRHTARLTPVSRQHMGEDQTSEGDDIGGM